MKPDSTYNKGMRPLVYSVKEAEKLKIGWQRECFNIAYYQTGRTKIAFRAEETYPSRFSYRWTRRRRENTHESGYGRYGTRKS